LKALPETSASDRFPVTRHPAILPAALLALMVGAASAAEISQPKGVVELFTSQGCSSCPPADRLLEELASGDDTLALGWHVDYWDYLGWKDTFGDPSNTERQRGYARTFGEPQVYTPQAVINGRVHVVGSKRDAVLSTLEEFAGTSNGLPVPIDVALTGDTLKVHVPLTPPAAGATLWMVYMNRRAEVEIPQGENKGKRIAYANVVRDVEMIGMVRDQELQTEFMLKDIGRRGSDACALLLQKSMKDGAPGPIIGATLIRNLSD